MNAPVDAWLDALDPARRAALGRRYQRLAADDGAYVLVSDGARLPIPPILSPVVMPEADQRALGGDARLLVRAIHKLSSDLVVRGDPALREQLLAPLSPLERRAVDVAHAESAHLATARVDFLVGDDGLARALEINATIPAMQGYADAIAGAWLRAVGEERGASPAAIDAVIARNGRNADDLLASLLAHHARLTGRAGAARRLAIVARPGDAQSGELDHYVHRWTTLGHEVVRVTPDRVAPAVRDGAGPLADGREVDLIYRHVFLRRLDPDGPFAAMLLDPRRHRILNPPASQLELKGMLGLLSAGLENDAACARAGIDDDERAAAARRLPWTRLCVRGPTRGPDGGRVDDVVAFTRANPARLVLKRSWDYGGRGVFLGAELDEPMAQARLRELLGGHAHAGPVSWAMLVEHIERSGEAWVVQALVDVQRHGLLRVEDTGPVRRALYADLSAFTSLGAGAELAGGAVRASGGRIVNIQGGGGLCPLVRQEALDLLHPGFTSS